MNTISKIKKWLGSRKIRKYRSKEYIREKRDFQMAIGKPFITVKIDLPKGFEDDREEFMNLQENHDFQDELTEFVKKNLLLLRRERKKRKTETN